MLYVKSESGEMVPITTGGVFAKCPTCGAVHQVDLIGIMEQHIGNIEGVFRLLRSLLQETPTHV